MGILRLISVPIGNLEDITIRALNALKNENIFFVEDTRSFYSLLKLLGIDRQNILVDSFHDQSVNKIDRILKLLDTNESVNIVSEAGSPIISDPAYPVITAAIAKGHQIESLPGVCSLIVALELSGLPVHPFKFFGFFPRKRSEIIKVCNDLKQNIGTYVLFESPHRLIATIKTLHENLAPYTQIAVCRELTKKFETVYRFNLDQTDQFIKDYSPKGEAVICVYNQKMTIISEEALKIQKFANTYLEKPTKKNVSKLLSLILDRATKDIYSELQ